MQTLPLPLPLLVPRCPQCIREGGRLGTAAATFLGAPWRPTQRPEGNSRLGIPVTSLHPSCKRGWENICHSPRPSGWEIPQTQQGGSERQGVPMGASTLRTLPGGRPRCLDQSSSRVTVPLSLGARCSLHLQNISPRVSLYLVRYRAHVCTHTHIPCFPAPIFSM